MKFRNLVIVVSLLALIVLSAYAWAGPGRGYGGRGCGGWDYGEGQARGGGWGQLSSEEAQKATEEREAFFEATRELRQNLYEKRSELNNLLAGDLVDEAKVTMLQKEISDLNAELDQQWIQHRIRMKAISPLLGRGPGNCFGGRGNRGGPCYGSGYGRGGNAGNGYGGGCCWR